MHQQALTDFDRLFEAEIRRPEARLEAFDDFKQKAQFHGVAPRVMNDKVYDGRWTYLLGRAYLYRPVN